MTDIRVTQKVALVLKDFSNDLKTTQVVALVLRTEGAPGGGPSTGTTIALTGVGK